MQNIIQSKTEETEEDANKWKDIPCLWIKRISTVQTTILPKTTYRLNAVSYQNSNGIFHRSRIDNPKIHVEPQRPSLAKAIIKKKNKAGGIMLPPPQPISQANSRGGVRSQPSQPALEVIFIWEGQRPLSWHTGLLSLGKLSTPSSNTG